MIAWYKFPKQNAEAGGDAGGGGGAPAAPAAPAAAPATGGEPSGGPSLLATGGVPQAPLHERIPEKFRVFGEDKALNLEASAAKLLDSYSYLEKKVGAGDLPPDSPDAYALDDKAFGEGVDVRQVMSDEATKGFLKRMHAKGATNAQIQEIMEFGLKEWAPQLMAGNQLLNADQVMQTLRTDVWKTEAEYTQNMGAANRLFRSLPTELQKSVDQRLGNDPVFLQVAALFGREIAEDKSPTETHTSAAEQATVEKLMLSDAYRNPKNPDHERISAQVRAYFEKSSRVA